MILTEEEAKTKRCQESFPASQGTSSNGATVAVSAAFGPAYSMGGGFALSTAPTHCIGSACMAWRWLSPDDGEVIVINGQLVSTGYCGKAGKP